MKKQIVCLMIFLAGISFTGFSQATFSVDVNAGCAPVCVNFSDLSMNGLSWQWDFGDASTSTIQNPSHCFVNAGSYIVILIVQFASGPDTAYGTISVLPLPVAGFSSANIGANTIIFSDLSIGAVWWNWDFGDATTSNQQNPTHTYASSNLYAVTLTVANMSGCTDSITQPVIPTAINNFYSSIGWSIYPNPSQGQISIYFESALQNAEMLRIENMLGKIILQKEISSDATIDLSDHSAGIYFIRIGNSSPQKLVIE